ncbi:MAG: response regulator, partial [Planctomycetes bacterium]|nr:response regulator [Planctomycetota bacterium]
CSSDLRNPLGAIRTAVAAMESAREDRTVADRSLAIVTRQCAQLSRLLDDLLDASRIAHDRLLLQPEVCDIAVLARATVEAMQPTFSAAGVDLRIALPNDPVKARVDPVRVQQILDNLLGNAAKFTPRGGSVALTLTTDAGSFAIEVADTGIGIATERLDSVFELFVQLADRTDTSGLGIGLSLVRRLAELHGGSATVHSAGLGHGSKFTVRLPRSHDDAAAAIPPPPVAKPTAPRRVLIIEDMADNAAAMVMLLRHHGHRTWVANDSATGIATALRERPDVILLDLGLPDADGYETCRALRAAGLDGLVIAVTGWGQFEDRERTRAAGFDVHLTKPVDPQRILDLIASARRSAP